MKITVFDPHAKLTPEIVGDMLLLAAVDIPPHIIAVWTPNELALAYDWAAREHLSASDNSVRRRPKPWFIIAAGLLEFLDGLCACQPPEGQPRITLADGWLHLPDAPGRECPVHGEPLAVIDELRVKLAQEGAQ